MAKEHTVHKHDRKLVVDQRFRDFAKTLSSMISRDESDRGTWEENKLFFQRRRYQEEWRDVSFPWPGASDIVMPLIDKKFDELKPQYLSMIFGVDPPVTVTSIVKEHQRNVRNVEMMFDWLINFGGSPDFMRETFLLVDSTLTGRGIAKTFWRYETRTAPETITMNRLPASLLQLIVADSEEEADRINLFTQRPVLSKREFRQNRGTIEETLARIFQLDPEEPGEKAQISRVTNWFRDGAREPLTIEKRDIVIDAPAMMSVHPMDMIVPANATSLQEAERLTQKIFLSRRQIRQQARDQLWREGDTKEFLSRIDRMDSVSERTPWAGASSGPISDQFRDEEFLRSGVSGNIDTDSIELWMCYTWFDYNGDGIDEKIVLLFPARWPDIILKAYAYERPSARWPFEESLFELNLPFFYSERGLGEKLDDLDREITSSHRSKINNMLISTAPTFKYRRGARVNLRGHHWVPGEGIPVDSMEDLDVLAIPDRSLSEEREEQVLRTWAEDYIGGTDFGLTSQSSLTEPRTATELNQIKDRARMSLSMRGMLFTDAMNHVFDEFHDMMIEYGPSDLWLNASGIEAVRLSREDIQGNFTFRVTATIGETDPILNAQKKLNRIFVTAQLVEKGLIPPRWEVDMGEMILDWLETEDIRLAHKVIRERSPEEIQQILAQQQRMQQLEEAANRNIPMSEDEHMERLKLIKSNSPFKGLQRIR